MDFKDETPDPLLLDRHKREEQYHDLKNLTKIDTPKHYLFNPTYRVFQKMKQRIAVQPHGKILEMGCGSGWITAELAATGACIEAFDISGEAIEKTRKFLTKLNLASNCNLRKMAAEKLDYLDNTFECIVGFAILHHLDLEVALPEVYRVLKPGGTAFFAEPLGENPFINIYRKFTPEFRSTDERPLFINQFIDKVSFFHSVKHDEFFLTALFAMGVAYLPIFNKYFSPLLTFLMVLDEKLLARFPSVGRWAWYSLLELKK